MHHEDGEDLAENVEVAPAAADIVQQRTAHVEGALLCGQPVLLCKRKGRVGDVAHVDLVGRMHRREKRQGLCGQVRTDEGAVALIHALGDGADELAHAPPHAHAR